MTVRDRRRRPSTRQLEIVDLLYRRRPAPVSLEDVRATSGAYSTNVIRALLERALIEYADRGRLIYSAIVGGSVVVGRTFRLTAAGEQLGADRVPMHAAREKLRAWSKGL